MNSTTYQTNGSHNLYKFYGLLAIAGLLLGLLAATYGFGSAYFQQRQNCLSLPNQYDFLNTRYHFGQCQFQENDGWIGLSLN